MQLLDTLRNIQSALVEVTSQDRDTAKIGGFTAMLHPTDPLVWINYAVPTSATTESDVRALADHFKTKDRAPRLEFFADLWPETVVQLEAAGFVCEKKMPIMVLPKESWIPLPSPLQARMVGPEELGTVQAVSHSAFGMPDGPSDPDESSIRAVNSGRHLVSLVELDGKPAGSGYAVGNEKIREVAGIGTLEEFRRRGVGSAVIDRLLHTFFEQDGEIAWLTPGDDGAQALYEHLGFRSVATQVCYELSS